ncbi:MAG: pentapeptide repeat-containing protein, partial [Bacteroidetes bacterium]|nr:pentapeptide repeat-containing protein [Bacteroidota bacterium]
MSSKRLPFYVISFVFVVLVIIGLWMFVLEKANLSDIAVEFHGMLFDVFLFGIIFTFYEQYLDLKKKKEDLLEQVKSFEREIDDFRDWHELESKYRIFGNIKRIRQLIESENLELKLVHDLHDCYLPEINLREKNFSGTNFKNAILTGIKLDFGVFIRTNFSEAVLDQATVFNTTLGQANLLEASLKGAIICSDFSKTIFGNTDFSEAIFYKADFTGINLDELKLKGVKYDSTTRFSKKYTKKELKK